MQLYWSKCESSANLEGWCVHSLFEGSKQLLRGTAGEMVLWIFVVQVMLQGVTGQMEARVRPLCGEHAAGDQMP